MRIAKIVLAAVGAVVVLLVVAVVIVASTFDPNDYKSVATDAFTARTGRTLTIDEDLRLAGNAVALGYAKGLEDAGYDIELRELHYALAKALTEPKAEARYRRGKRPFV